MFLTISGTSKENSLLKHGARVIVCFVICTGQEPQCLLCRLKSKKNLLLRFDVFFAWLGQLVNLHLTVLSIPDFLLQSNMVMIILYDITLQTFKHNTCVYKHMHHPFPMLTSRGSPYPCPHLPEVTGKIDSPVSCGDGKGPLPQV